MSKRNSLYANPELCKHLADYKLKHGVNGYCCLQNWLKVIPSGKPSIRKYQTKIPRCSFCHKYEGRFFICLICSSISCSSHTLLHSESNNGHDIAVDMERAELYCCSCRDQVYDPDFDKVVVCKQIIRMHKDNNNGDDGESGSSFVGILSKRRKVDSRVELDLIMSKQLGLRGLNNLGSTCFMNSVLQALLHAAPFRNYFLSGRHNRDHCRKGHGRRLCLPCDIHMFFSSMFSGDRIPYSPAPFLYSWWQHSANLASYEEQDSHEFFISVLDGIHEKEYRTGPPKSKDHMDCKCIAHRVFSGLLKSDVTCMTCGFTSTTYDPCIDLSLNLDTANFTPTDKGNKSVRSNESASTSTLLGCLDLFTKSEKLGSDQKLFCQNCQERRDSIKQMSIRKLPMVLCLHIKRFEHSLVRKTSRKIDHYLQFPFSLDMTPYLSSSILRSEFGNRIFPFEGNDLDSSAEFEIFAVITHSGMLESGHYVTYLRLKDHWYKCDDAWITEVDEKVVRASQCYMLFYVQKTLLYKVNDDPNGLPISPWRDPFVPIAGCC